MDSFTKMISIVNDLQEEKTMLHQCIATQKDEIEKLKVKLDNMTRDRDLWENNHDRLMEKFKNQKKQLLECNTHLEMADEKKEQDEFYKEQGDDLDAHLDENSELYSSSVWEELTNEEKRKIMDAYEKNMQINHDIMMYGHSDLLLD